MQLLAATQQHLLGLKPGDGIGADEVRRERPGTVELRDVGPQRVESCVVNQLRPPQLTDEIVRSGRSHGTRASWRSGNSSRPVW